MLSRETVERRENVGPALAPAQFGGREGEDNTIHHVPLAREPAWLDEEQRRGAQVDPKVYAALWFASRP